jgi:hypothetical protein
MSDSTFRIEQLEDQSYVVVQTTDGKDHQHPTRFATRADAERYCSDNGFPL